jgi:Carboxypeptidase regulatory-like domain
MTLMLRSLVAGMALLALTASDALAQGVTTGSLAGLVTDQGGAPVAGASVIAIHLPSGSNYEATTRADGRFVMPGMRVGGPYSVTVAYQGTGNAFEPLTQDNVMVNLGVATDLPITVRSIAVTETVTVTASTSEVFSSTRTGAATTVVLEQIANLPNVSNRLEQFTRLTPQASGSTFAGQDNRLNNITVDGSYFNNSFGLGGQPGDRTGVAPISPYAIEQIQVSVAPFDVRQGNFVGAGVNTVTRSGTNQFSGSLYRQFRNEDMVGEEAKGLAFNPGTFEFANTGGNLGGPILKNRLFFFGNLDTETLEQPGTTFTANPGGAAAVGNMTRVLASDISAIGALLNQRFQYDPGTVEGYPFKTPGDRYLAKLDFNLNSSNKITARYVQLDSESPVLASNSSSLGFGNRRTSTQAINFSSSNYSILENIKSGVGEWNSTIGGSMANSLIVGYTSQDESRGPIDKLFPFVDILNNATTYTSFGSEPFTPNNELRYKTFQVQNNFSKFIDRHTLTLGATLQRYESENVFFPGSQSVYVYNSLQDFFTDINDYAANPNRTVSPISLRRFQVRWNNIPGQDKPIQPLEVLYGGAYLQDEWRPSNNLTLSAGLRFDVPKFGNTGYTNAVADALTFRDEDGQPVQYSSGKLPDSNILWSPRFGFNYALDDNRTTQVRGGSGIFTAPPAYVWISNQIGNTGVLTGFEQLDNTTARPFNPDPNRYKPTNVTGAPSSSFELALTNQDFKFPQLWRNNIAIDQRLPLGFSSTTEFIYNRDVNGVYYINANLPAAQSAFTGADTRPRWTSNRIHAAVANAVVLKNQNVGSSWNISTSLDKRLRGNFVKAAYNYGSSRNTVDPGSIAFGSWNNNEHSGDPNNPGVAYSPVGRAGHRFFLTGTVGKDLFSFGRTSLSAFYEMRNNNVTSYTYSGDLNGDGGTSNDLIYIPRNTSEMNFQEYTTGGRTFTAAQQAAAWEAYIAQDPYLSERRGEYAKRGGVLLPFVHRMDFSIAQDLFTNIRGRRHSLQVRLDMLNFGNLLNSDWGVGQRLISNQPLTVTAGQQADAQGRAQYRLRAITGASGVPELMSRSFENTAFLTDVYRFQIMVRYQF